MIRVLVPAPATRANSTGVNNLQWRIAEWMKDNDIEHWASYRQNYSYWGVEFFGLNYEQDALAFKIAFGGI